MIYSALGKEWEIAFPFEAQRRLEERYNKGFYGVVRMVTPSGVAGIDIAKNPDKLLDALADVRVGVLVDLLHEGTKGMSEEQAGQAFEEMKLLGTFEVIMRALNPEVEDDAPRPPVKKKTPSKKPAG